MNKTFGLIRALRVQYECNEYKRSAARSRANGAQPEGWVHIIIYKLGEVTKRNERSTSVEVNLVAITESENKHCLFRSSVTRIKLGLTRSEQLQVNQEVSTIRGEAYGGAE